MKNIRHIHLTPFVLLGLVLAMTAAANGQRRVRSANGQWANQARQALMHNQARHVNYDVPPGYRTAQSRVRRAAVDSRMEPLPMSESVEPDMLYDDGAIYDDGVIYDDGSQPSGEFGDWDDSWDNQWEDDAACDGCATGCDSCTACGASASWAAALWTLQDASIFAGVQGFTGPLDLGSTGSFGFHEGFNLGMPMPLLENSGIGAQIGVRTLQSNLSGADFTSSQRNQTMLTVGGFRRADCGLQAGLVVDMMRDIWYDRIDLTQLRGEISWKFLEKHEWGYWFTASTGDDTSINPINPDVTDRWETTQLNAFFYRRRMELVPGGRLSLLAGFSGKSDGLIGTKAFLPITNGLAFQTDFMYLTPNEPTLSGGTLNESWNLGLALVWRLGMNAQTSCDSYYLPMFDVADNGTMMVDRISQ